MLRVKQDEFMDFISDYHTIATGNDYTMRFSGRFSGECIGRITYGDTKKYYINKETHEPVHTVSISDDGIVQHTYSATL
jgi:hypothetical protein